MKLTLQFVGDRELIARLESLPSQVQLALRAAVLQSLSMLRALIQNKFLSGPTGAHTLSVRTGALRRSIAYDLLRDDTTAIIGHVYYTADVPYAAIHEFGGTIHLPEIRPINAKALHFTWQGAERFFMKVRAHDVVIPRRAPMQTAFEQSKPEIIARLRKAVILSVKAGVPR